MSTAPLGSAMRDASYQVGGPFLATASRSLTGVDVFYRFGTGETEWFDADADGAEWNSASRAKWTIATPTVWGQFPAAALMFCKGVRARGYTRGRRAPHAGAALGPRAADRRLWLGGVENEGCL